MINLPNGATLSVEPTVTSLDGKWVADGNTGQISYYALPVAAAAPITQTKSSSLGGGIGYSPQGASGTQVTQAISGILPGNTAVTVDTAPQILNATNVPATPGGRGALAEAVLLNSTTPMSTQNIMVASTTPNVSSTLSDAMNGSSTPKDIAQGLAQITLVGGPSVAQAASNAIKPPDLDTQNTVNLTNAGAKLLSYYQSLPLSTIPNLPTHEINSASKALPQPTTGAGAPTLPKVGGPSVALSDDEQEAPGEEAEALAYGAAAGSSPYEKFGVWGLINGGIAHQKMLKGNSGFKSVSKGATIGVDTMISEKSIIGLTISNSMNNIKMRDTNAGDKTSISSWIATLYGSRQLKNNWFIRGSALFNRTHINSKSLRPVRGGYGIAQARYNAMSYGGEVAVGFNHIFKNGIIATPNVGFRVIHNNQLSYSEKGNTIFNNSLKQNAINNYSVIAGLSVSKGFSKYGIDFTPEAHVNMQYGVNTKTPQGTFVSSITPNQISNFISTKSSKFSSTYGVSLTGASDRLECGVTADMSISQKYVGYQGSLKLKVKF